MTLPGHLKNCVNEDMTSGRSRRASWIAHTSHHCPRLSGVLEFTQGGNSQFYLSQFKSVVCKFSLRIFFFFFSESYLIFGGSFGQFLST